MTIDSVKILKIGPMHESPKKYYAELQIGDKKRIFFRNLTKASFVESNEIDIHMMDQWVIATYGCSAYPIVYDSESKNTFSSTYSSLGFQVGDSSDFKKIFAFDIKNVYDVIENYDSLLAIIDSIPETPKYLLNTNNKKEFYYWKRDSKLVSLTDSNLLLLRNSFKFSENCNLKSKFSHPRPVSSGR